MSSQSEMYIIRGDTSKQHLYAEEDLMMYPNFDTQFLCAFLNF